VSLWTAVGLVVGGEWQAGGSVLLVVLCGMGWKSVSRWDRFLVGVGVGVGVGCIVAGGVGKLLGVLLE
jgi:hypothetical protein